MFVLGIDPGLSRCGYGCVEGRGQEGAAVAMGVLTTPPSEPLPQRLAHLEADLEALLADLRPDAVAVERLFFQVNARTAMAVGQASGLVLAAAARSGAEVAQYTPNEVKQAVAGYGAAPKEQVQRMVQALLGLAQPPRPADAADALALALCHLATAPLRARIGSVT
jgi:crossover junction endodeoxyribonuclease RuvC